MTRLFASSRFSGTIGVALAILGGSASLAFAGGLWLSHGEGIFVDILTSGLAGCF